MFIIYPDEEAHWTKQKVRKHLTGKHAHVYTIYEYCQLRKVCNAKKQQQQQCFILYCRQYETPARSVQNKQRENICL